MQPTNEAYREAITAPTRHIIPRVVADLTDPDVVFGAVNSSAPWPFNRPGDVYSRQTELSGHYLTPERNRFLLDGRGKLYTGEVVTEHQGYTIDTMSNEQAVFTSANFVQINFTGYRVLQAASVFFSVNPLDGFGVDFVFEIYVGAGVVFRQEVVGNTAHEVFFDGFTIYEPTAVRITFTRWSLPFRRIRIATVILGIYEAWTGRELAKLDVLQETSLSNATVPYGVATVVVWNKDKRFNPYQKSGVFKSITDRQKLDISMGIYLDDGSVMWLPIGSYYQEDGGWETNAYEQTCTFRLIDIVGLLSTRPFAMPTPAPTTVEGWVAALVAHLGVNFVDRYIVDDTLADLPLTGSPQNTSCGDVLRYICMTIGAYFSADAATGKLRVFPLPSTGSGTLIDLDNQHYFPANKARDDIASITFELSTGARHTVIGTNMASENGINIRNPFLHTVADAEQAARNILIHYGGTEFTVRGRGDLASEVGDIDQLETGFDTIVTARRYRQQYTINDGVLDSAPSGLYLSTGIELYEGQVRLSGQGNYTVPAGATSLRLIITQGGQGGTDGTNGSWDASGTPGQGGQGGKVYVVTINVNPGSTFAYSVGPGGAVGGEMGAESVFGNYSSASGVVMDAGFSDVYGGGVYGRHGANGGIGSTPGVAGTDGTGQGGGGGDAGWAGERDGDDIIRRRGPGQKGAPGGSGSIAVSFLRG